MRNQAIKHCLLLEKNQTYHCSEKRGNNVKNKLLVGKLKCTVSLVYIDGWGEIISHTQEHVIIESPMVLAHVSRREVITITEVQQQLGFIIHL